jgi:hypothetical protein
MSNEQSKKVKASKVKTCHKLKMVLRALQKTFKSQTVEQAANL